MSPLIPLPPGAAKMRAGYSQPLLLSGRLRALRRYACLVFSSLFAVGLLVGCASTTSDQEEPRPREGIAEYRQVATEAEDAMRAALTALATVSAQSNRCAPDVLSAFSAELQRLQVNSIPLRARARAMQARGDAYFEHWGEHLARVQDPQLRAIAETRRPELEESFHRIKLLSQESREAFAPFLTNLRNLRNALEADPASLTADATQNWIATARENGEHVERCLAGIVRELDSMRAMLVAPAGDARQ